jgi:hypothetical protein
LALPKPWREHFERIPDNQKAAPRAARRKAKNRLSAKMSTTNKSKAIESTVNYVTVCEERIAALEHELKLANIRIVFFKQYTQHINAMHTRTHFTAPTITIRELYN